MATGTISCQFNVAGQFFNGSYSRTATGQIAHDPTLGGAKAGTLGTRTDNDTGVATLSGGHGIVNSDKVDVYWATGIRRGMTATVSTNDVTVDGGAGDNLPAQSTAVLLCVQEQIDTDLDGDLIEMIAIVATERASVAFHKADNSLIAAIELAANEPWIWVSDGGIANPFTGDPIGYIAASCGDADGCDLKIGILYASS